MRPTGGVARLVRGSNSTLNSTNARAQYELESMQLKQRDCSDRMAIQPMSSRFCILLAFAALPLSAQWLNHIPAGTPMKDGKPNLSAPAPRATNGKPDLTGVWMHETFSLEQMKKFYGPAADEEANIGMEIFTVHKYGLNALLDAKPGEQVMTRRGSGGVQAAPADSERQRCLPQPLRLARAFPAFRAVQDRPGTEGDDDRLRDRQPAPAGLHRWP